MATNTHIPVRSARRCILRSAVAKFLFATAVAIATSSALALSGTLTAGPGIAQATGPSAARAVSGQGYGYPVKPFDREHLIRANFGDPRMQFHGPPTLNTLLHADGSFSFHQGVDISASGGTAVYPVVDGTVTYVSSEWIRVTSGGRAFEYWHIGPLVRKGQQVTARHTLLGRVTRISNHVHLTEYEGGRVVNPLVPGRLTPYHDSSSPVVRAITFRQSDGGPDVLPIFVRGRIEIVVNAEDAPTAAGFRKWYGPVTPALITCGSTVSAPTGTSYESASRETSGTECPRTRPSGRRTPVARTRTRWSGGITTRTKSAARTSSSSRSTSTLAPFATASTT